MASTLPDMITRTLNASNDQDRCRDAVEFLAQENMPQDVANFLSEVVDRYVRDDSMATDLHVRLAMNAGLAA